MRRKISKIDEGEGLINKTIYTPVDVLDAFAHIASEAFNCMLEDSFQVAMKPCVDLLAKKYGFTPMQSYIIAIIIDQGNEINSREIANVLSIPNAVMMRHEACLEELVQRRVLRKVKGFRSRGIYNYELRPDARKAFCENMALDDVLPTEITVDSFIKELNTTFTDAEEEFIDKDEMCDRLSEILEKYASLNVVKMIVDYQLDPNSQYILLALLNKSCEDESASWPLFELNEIISDSRLANRIARSIFGGSHELVRKDVIEFVSEDGMAGIDRIVLSSESKKRFSEEMGFVYKEVVQNIKGLTHADSITQKSLFYNNRETTEVNRLRELLTSEHFAEVQQRLEEAGMRKGFACLFYGSPGTGKTETVLQLARQTGRDIMQVDLSTVRSKFVGETEKNVKSIFEQYRRAVSLGGNSPILLLNEADAIICRRSTNTERAVDKMENAMQNIILQEMEKLEGILIATTNLTDNMDSAFARRFLYKIRFDRPSAETKSAIWQSVMPQLSENEAMTLASAYDLSGGQIENIVRKQLVDYVISGKGVTLDKMHEYCRTELTGDYTRRQAIGFK